jgi:hypothetical protein
MALEVRAKVGRDEPGSLTDSHIRKFAALEQRVNLAARDSKKRRCPTDAEERLHLVDLQSSWRVGAHDRTLPHDQAAKLTHNREDELARFFVDEDDASIVPVTLIRDDSFQEKARLVASAEDRLAKAESEAESYVPYAGRHRGERREFIVQLLLEAAARADALGEPEMHDEFANRHRKAVWAEPEALTELDPRRVRDRTPMLRRGAKYFVNFGAFKCLHCGVQFVATDRYVRVGVSRRRSRRWHCDACEMELGTLVGCEIREMWKAVSAATGRYRQLRAARRAV